MNKSISKAKKCCGPIKNDDIYKCLEIAITKGPPPSVAKFCNDSIYDQKTRRSAYELYRGRHGKLSVKNVFVPHLGKTQKRIMWQHQIVITEDEREAVYNHYRAIILNELDVNEITNPITDDIMIKRISQFYAGFRRKYEEFIPARPHRSTTYKSTDDQRTSASRSQNNSVGSRLDNLERSVRSIVTHIKKNTNTLGSDVYMLDNEPPSAEADMPTIIPDTVQCHTSSMGSMCDQQYSGHLQQIVNDNNLPSGGYMEMLNNCDIYYNMGNTVASLSGNNNERPDLLKRAVIDSGIPTTVTPISKELGKTCYI